MKIKSLELKNFKRFADLTLKDIPENARLVLLIGSNGSGKSAVFDAFEAISTIRKPQPYNEEYSTYYKKIKNIPFSIKLDVYDKGSVVRIDGSWQYPNNSDFLKVDSFYGRSSFRQIPKLQRTQMGQLGSIDFKQDSDRPKMYIEKDNRFESDIEIITEHILREFFRSNRSNEQIKERYIDPINRALENVFSKDNGTKLTLIEIIPPLEGKIAQINFRKGNSEIHYNYLSAGEKEVINIFFNLLSRRDFFQDTIYFLDELDLHLNTALQRSLLKEIIENWIPPNCQLWTAPHSLGFIHYAQQSEHSTIFDFDDFDFDYSRVLTPVPKDDPDIYEIAVGRNILPVLFKSFVKIFVENTDGDNYYSNLIIDNFLFVKRKDKKAIYDNILSGDNLGLIDRDFLSDYDIAVLENAYKNLRILKMYSVENYLFHPCNLVEYCRKQNIPFDEQEYINELLTGKENIKHELFAKISDSRQTYPFGKEIDPIDKTIQVGFSKSDENRKQIAVINKEIDSNDFDGYYKHIPMKNYLTQLQIRKKTPKTELSKTEWFKQQIEAIIKLK